MNRRISLPILFALLAIAAIILCFVGCHNDVAPPVHANLTGEYAGTYSWAADSLGQPPDIEPIIWIFGNGYSMKFDTTKALEADRKFCDIQGAYELTDAVVLHQLQANLGSRICDTTKNPTGRFVILAHSPDTLSMVQIIGSVIRRIELSVKKP
jgi:hypothetical protein